MDTFGGDLSSFVEVGHNATPTSAALWWWWWLIKSCLMPRIRKQCQLMVLWSTKDAPHVRVNEHGWNTLRVAFTLMRMVAIPARYVLGGMMAEEMHEPYLMHENSRS